MYKPTCTLLSPYSLYARSFLRLCICTFLFPLLCLYLPLSAHLCLPFSASLSIIFSLCSTFFSSQKIKKIYYFCALIPTYQNTRRHMPENGNIKVFIHIKEAMRYSQVYKRTILCNWNAVQSNEVGKEAPDRCPVSYFKGRRTSC